MHDVFLQDLAVLMLVAGVVTLLFHRFKQPVVLGYLIAGVVVGPHTPPFTLIHDEDIIKTLSELGVVFLMFSLGLEFSLRKLKAVGVTAFIAAFLEIVLMFWAGYEVGTVFGWKKWDSIFLGAMLSISSTTIIVKALAELGRSREKFAELIFGILVIEDILAIVMIAILSGVVTSGAFNAGDIVTTTGQLAAFLVATLVIGLLLVPRFIGYVAKFRSNEMLLITVLALCLGVSLLAVKLKYSVALGAFLIGAIIAESTEIVKIEKLMEPVRDFFSAIFFVSIGLLIQPKLLITYAWPIFIITIVVIVGKVLACSFGTFTAGHDTRTSLRVGMGLAQIGEFSFIIAAMGATRNVTSDFLYPIGVTVSALTTLATPYLIRGADRLVVGFDRVAPEKLTRSLDSYTGWAGRLGKGGESGFEGALIRKLLGQVLINVILIAGIFICASYLGESEPAWLPAFLGRGARLDSVMWLGSIIVSLPLFIASFIKLQSVGVLASETIQFKGSEKRVAFMRGAIIYAIPGLGTTFMTILMFRLGTNILPPLKQFFFLLAIGLGAGWLLWRSAVKLYSKAQMSLHLTFSRPSSHEEKPAHSEPELHAAPPSPAVAAALTELGRVKVAPDSKLVGLVWSDIPTLLGDESVRAVALERGGSSVMDLQDSDDIRESDVVVLLGSPAAVKATVAKLKH
jgi:CPA2 family monovalent cation:H+ antiporter-2